jgi:integrase
MPDQRKSRYPGVYPSGRDTWQYKLRLPPDPETGKRPIETRGGYHTDYEAHLARSGRQVELGLGINTAPSDLTVTQAVAQYIAGRRMKPNSRLHYTGLLQRYITPHIGAIRAQDLTAARVRTWQTTLLASGSAAGKPLSTSVVRKTQGLLWSAIEQLRSDGRLARNVVDRVERLEVPKPASAAWTNEQAARFLVVADQDEYAALWRLALLSLLRPGELLALRWQDVDLARRIVTVSQTVTRDDEGRWTVGPPKTAASAAEVGFTDETADQLRQLHDRQRLAARFRPDGWRHDLVFPNQRGRMMTHISLGSRLRVLCSRAGVPYLSPHGLRHSGADAMIRAGVDPTSLTRALRHERPEFSLRVYTRANLADQQAAVARLQDALTPRMSDDETAASSEG